MTIAEAPPLVYRTIGKGQGKHDIIIKERGFCPNPVVRHGIPFYADSSTNPGCLGTQEHEDWWFQQFDYCINGYVTGGVWIPGIYYFYLNFYSISTLKRGTHYPEYVDFDLEYFRLIEYAKDKGKGIIILKSRRKGMSEKFGCILRHGCMFTPEKFVGGVVAGLETYSMELAEKYLNSNSMLPPEMQLNMISSVTEESICGYEVKAPTGFVKRGSFNKVIVKTMHSKPNVMKGFMYNIVGFEEAGEFDLLIKGYGQTKKCFAVGADVEGLALIYGTGGNVKTSSSGFKKMWSKPEDYGLIKLSCYAQRLMVGYFMGSINRHDKLEENCPNIKALMREEGLSYEQVLGCEDIPAALEQINIEIEAAANSNDREFYYETLQNSCRNEQEAFLSYTGNDYKPEKINNQLLEIESGRHRVPLPYIPEWVYEDRTNEVTGVTTKQLKTPLEVKMRSITSLTDKALDNCVWIYNHPPPGGVQNLFAAGLDGYDIDKSQTSNSLGSMVVITRPTTIRNFISKQAVAVIYCRPDRKEEFYNLCLATSVYYNLTNDVLCDARSPLVIDYFENNGGKKFLAYRPQAFESDRSGQQHEFGFKETPFSKPQKLSLIQTWTLDNIHECWFEQIVTNIRDFDKDASQSDWDAHDALGLALIQLINNPVVVQDSTVDMGGYDPFATPIFATTAFGGAVVINQNQMTPKYTSPVDSDEYYYDPFG